MIDYNEYRKLEDKRDRILLKKTLYERKKDNDERQVRLLNEELTQQHDERERVNRRLQVLRDQLEGLQRNIVSIERNRRREVKQVEQKKRQDIIRRAGKDIPYQSHSGAVTSDSRSRSINASRNPSINTRSKSPINKRGIRADAQAKGNSVNTSMKQSQVKGAKPNGARPNQNRSMVAARGRN